MAVQHYNEWTLCSPAEFSLWHQHNGCHYKLRAVFFVNVNDVVDKYRCYESYCCVYVLTTSFGMKTSRTQLQRKTNMTGSRKKEQRRDKPADNLSKLSYSTSFNSVTNRKQIAAFDRLRAEKDIPQNSVFDELMGSEEFDDDSFKGISDQLWWNFIHGLNFLYRKHGKQIEDITK